MVQCKRIKKFLINILNPYLRAHIRAMRSRVRARNSYCLPNFLHRCLPHSPTRLAALVAKPIAKRQPACRAAFHTACQTANILFSRHIFARCGGFFSRLRTDCPIWLHVIDNLTETHFCAIMYTILHIRRRI